MHKPARSIINEDEQSATRGAALEPVVSRAVYLAELSEAASSLTALVNAGRFGPAWLPKASADHQLADSLDREFELMRLGEFLTGKSRPEVVVVGADERKSLVQEFLRQAVIARFAATFRD